MASLSLSASVSLRSPVEAAPRLAASSVLAECAGARSWGCASEGARLSCTASVADLPALPSCDVVEAPWVMAVPKKHKSRTKTKIHRAVWKSQAREEALKALSLAKSVLSGRSKSFVYVQNEKKEEGEKEAEGETPSE